MDEALQSRDATTPHSAALPGLLPPSSPNKVLSPCNADASISGYRINHGVYYMPLFNAVVQGSGNADVRCDVSLYFSELLYENTGAPYLENAPTRINWALIPSKQISYQ